MAESECGGEVWSPGVPTSYSTIPTHHNLNFQNNYKLENVKYKYKKRVIIIISKVPTSYSTIPTHHNLNFQNKYKLENGNTNTKNE